jgi:hypothetical protein
MCMENNMNETNTKYLLERCPKLYRQYSLPMTETCMCWGFDICNGWYDIIKELSIGIENLNDTIYTEEPVEAVQVKEKFGGLRFYVSRYDYDVETLIQKAELKADSTCEYCGKVGELRQTGWVKTMCDGCFDKWKEEREKI